MTRKSSVRRLHVRLNGRLAGFYDYTPSGGVTFKYADDWLDWENSFAISRQLPLSDETHKGEKVNAVFENLLPDNEKLRQIIAEKTAAKSIRPHDMLSAIGQDCVGAMQFTQEGEDPGDPFAVAGNPQSEKEIAETLKNLTFAPLGMKPDEPFRISLAGAQEKTAYLMQGNTWLRPEGLTPTTHIFKRPMGRVHDFLDMSESVENEFVCIKLAQELGLPANNVEIANFEDQKALVIERFDRTPRAKGGILRLPQEDFLQAMGLSSGQKYQQHGGPDATDCYHLLSGAISQKSDLKLFFKAQVFFWMIAAIDGHAKNFSVFIEPNGYRMTPLYDIMSAAPESIRRNFRNKDLQLAMSAGKRRHFRLDQLHPRHFIETAEISGRIPHPLLIEALVEIVANGIDAFDRTEEALPQEIPDKVAEPILQLGKQNFKILETFSESFAR